MLKEMLRTVTVRSIIRFRLRVCIKTYLLVCGRGILPMMIHGLEARATGFDTDT